MSEPVLTIHGLPQDLAAHTNQVELRRFLHVDLGRTVASIRELKLSPDQVSVFAPSELCGRREYVEVVIQITGIARGYGSEAYRRLTQEVHDLAVRFLEPRVPALHRVKVICDPHYNNDGFAEWTRQSGEVTEARE